MLEVYIDPGQKGGYTIFDTDKRRIIETGKLQFNSIKQCNPELKFIPVFVGNAKLGKKEEKETKSFIENYYNLNYFIEINRPYKDSATTAFALGYNFATLIKTVQIYRPNSLLFLEPKDWQDDMRFLVGGRTSRDTKEEALSFAKKFLSDALDHVAIPSGYKKYHDGMIDAIAMCGTRNFKKNDTGSHTEDNDFDNNNIDF